MVETNALHRMVCKCTQKCGECQINPCFHENFSMMPIRLFCCSTIVRLLLFLSTKYLLKISLITNLSMSDISSNSSSSKTIFRFALTFNAILAIFAQIFVNLYAIVHICAHNTQSDNQKFTKNNRRIIQTTMNQKEQIQHFEEKKVRTV